jgi:hypothetical protein
MKKAEVPVVLHIECLTGPIIPENALRKSPPVDESMFDLDALVITGLEHCLALLELQPCRRELLGYLLLYMAQYAILTSRASIRKTLARLYLSYICGRRYRQRSEDNLFLYLIKRTDLIFDDIERTSLEGGDVRENISRTLARNRKRLERSGSRTPNKVTKV